MGPATFGVRLPRCDRLTQGIHFPEVSPRSPPTPLTSSRTCCVRRPSLARRRFRPPPPPASRTRDRTARRTVGLHLTAWRVLRGAAPQGAQRDRRPGRGCLAQVAARLPPAAVPTD